MADAPEKAPGKTPDTTPEESDAPEKALEEVLRQHLPEPLRLLFFTSKTASLGKQQERLLSTLTKLSDRLSLEVYDLDAEKELAARYGVDKAPCTVIVGKRDSGIRFYGVTAGYELASLIEALLMTSNGRSGLPPLLEDWAKRIATPTRVEVFVTLTCPYCPKMVHLAQQLAVANENVRAEMLESAEFPDLARSYGQRGVPFVVVNGTLAFEGLLAPEEAILEILRVAAPDSFEALEAELRKGAGASHVKPPVEKHLYDAIVVGAGPAGMSAAVYAVRKGMDVLLLGDRLGGQIADTATIDNWLGARRVGGHDLALMFRAHVEHYALAEGLHVRVSAVRRKGKSFRVRTEEGKEYRARAVIYCAGKRYRTLGAPGEARFLGREIAFCATCDAPLFGGKRVAVVGGGNSAFTAVRDLIPYASELHLINILPDWQADRILQQEVGRHEKVKWHTGRKVLEFWGEQDLKGLRMEPVEGGTPEELPVDGVFLEIGLVPNSAPVAGLLTLNAQGEIPVRRDQSTEIPGFFAAGDVTDEPEKQIVVAEGTGAKAALAAYQYLLTTGWTPKVEAGGAEGWG